MQNNSSAIAVTGIACYYPGASDPKLLWENILTRRRQFRRTPDSRLPITDYFDPNPLTPDKTYGRQVAVLDGFEFDWIDKRIPKPTFEATDIVHWLALDTAMKAFTDAGYSHGSIPSAQTGVVIGNTLTGEVSRSNSSRLRWPYVAKALRAAGNSLGLDASSIHALEKTLERYYKQPFSPTTQDSLAGFLSNTIAGRICNYLDLHGGGYTVDGACSSSLIAIATAAERLNNGELNLALAGGVDISLDPFEMVGFAKTKALTNKDMSVYDLKASGFIPGEGCGFVVLKRLEDARRDGNYVYAVLRGWGISSDGAGVGITAPSATGQALALNRAYDKAGYDPKTLDFIEGHGTGTPVGDRTELNAIALAMGDSEKKRICGVTSLKSIIGHTKAAAGIGGFIKAAMAVNRRVMPPTAGCKEPNEMFEATATHLYPILQGECRSVDTPLRAGVSAMGFGGSNCHVTLESGDAPSPRLQPDLPEDKLLVSSQESELFAFSAESIDSLQRQVKDVAAIARHLSVGELVDFAADLTHKLDPKHPIRAAVLASTADELTDHLQWLEQTLIEMPPSVGEVKVNAIKTVWLSNAKSQCRIGLLFPGQGSQQLNMARMLMERFDWAKDMVRQADDWLQDMEISPVGPYIYRSLDRADDKEQIRTWKKELAQTDIAQPAICLASLIWMHYLQKLGIEAVAVGGHSLGELSAFYAAGAFDEKVLLQLAALRGQAMASTTNNAGTMASLACSKQQAEALLAMVSENTTRNVVIANINGPTQTIVSGSSDDVDVLIDLATDAGFQTRLLSVSNAFHSPFVAAAATKLRQSAQIPDTLGITRIPLFSSINGQPMETGLDLREHFSRQITAQVDFMALVESLSTHCDVLVEVGPGKVLSGLTFSIQGTEGPSCLPVESKGGADRDINTVVAATYANGGDIHWNVLYENRLVRAWVWPKQFIANPCETPFEEIELPSEAVGFGISNQLSQLTELSPQAFSNYLNVRAPFVAEMIKADVQHWPSDSEATFGDTLKDQALTDADSANPDGQSQTETGEGEQSIEDALLEKIIQETGFTKESIPLSARLLEDLRLESIKAGEIIGATAAKYGVAGVVEPPELANSTLTEIAEVIRHAVATGRVSSETKEQGKTWVRNFTVEYLPEDLPLVTSVQADVPENIDWTATNCLIACESAEVEFASCLREAMQAQGAQVQVVSFEQVCHPLQIEMTAFSHLIAILPRQSKATTISPNSLRAIVDRLQPFTAPPAADSRQHANLTVGYVQFGGGVFGTNYPGAAIDQTCTQALAASLHLERPDLKVRSLDFSPTVSPPQLAERVMAELATPEPYAAVGYNAELQRLMPRPVVQEAADYQPRSITWTGEDVMLVTGGAKGITAECAIALAESTGVKMALVGSSPQPNEADDNPRSQAILTTLKRFEEKSLTCRYYPCDVTDFEAVQNLVAQVQREMGAITGVIHGAAINRPRSLDSISTAEALTEIAPKLNGVINLCTALNDVPLKLFVGLSSIIGFTGMQRNGWYGFSNEAMELLLQAFGAQHPQTEVLCPAYGVWDEVGMGFEMGAVRFLRQMGIGAISKDEGVRRFLNLVHNDPGQNRILVTGPMRTMAASTAGYDTWRSQPKPCARASKFLTVSGMATHEPRVEIVTRTQLSLENHPYLKDHHYKGSYLFPTVFGLEAMAQAAALVIGDDDFRVVRIEDIQLERGIVVDPEKGTEIEIQAHVIERQTKDESRKVKAAIRTELSGFAKDHFSATFVLDIDAVPPREPVELPDTPLDIRPDEDLYGSLLFQGPCFQRLEQFYSITGDRYLFTAQQIATGESDNPDNLNETGLLGDPFFRDALLQSGQAAMPQDVCLPIGIDSWEIYPPTHRGVRSLTGVATLNAQDEQGYTLSIAVVDGEGNLIERLTGYRLRRLEHRPDNPTAQQLAHPDQRDGEILQAKLAEISKKFGMPMPAAAVMNILGLHQREASDRHQLELPLIQTVMSKLRHRGNGELKQTLAIQSQPFESLEPEFIWLESGKPVVQNCVPDNLDISLAHDDRVCLCVADYGVQGCDIEPVKPRTVSDWIALLGESRRPLLQQLMDMDGAALAGARIWTALEALVKAQHAIQNLDLRIDARIGDSILFSGDNLSQKIISFPIQLTRGQTRMIALVVHPQQ